MGAYKAECERCQGLEENADMYTHSKQRTGVPPPS